MCINCVPIVYIVCELHQVKIILDIYKGFTHFSTVLPLPPPPPPQDDDHGDDPHQDEATCQSLRCQAEVRAQNPPV